MKGASKCRFGPRRATGMFGSSSIKERAKVCLLRATQKIGKILDLDGSLNYSITNSKNPMRNGSNENPLFAVAYYRPRNADLKYYYDNYIDPTGGPRGRADQPNLDPYLLSRNAFRLFTDNRKIGRASCMERV